MSDVVCDLREVRRARYAVAAVFAVHGAVHRLVRDPGALDPGPCLG